MPPSLMAATLTISPDEKAMALVEVNLVRPDGRGFHRYQIIYVVRGDKLAEWRQDLGPRSQFVGAEFRLVGGIWHADGRAELIETVGHLQELADDFRNTRPPKAEGFNRGTRRDNRRPYFSVAR